VIEDLGVEREADRFYRVSHDEETYRADVENGGCTCPDFEYRGSEYLCKHVLKAALVEVFANTVSTRLVARVVRFAREQGYPVGTTGCNGPTAAADAVPIPCPECVESVRIDGVSEWEVFLALNGARPREARQ
jgi:hypothetical protein